MNEINHIKDQLEAILGAAAKILIRQEKFIEAHILANADPSIRLWNHDNWNGGQDTWRLYLAIPTDTYFSLERREDIQKSIDQAIAIPMEAVSDSDFIESQITTTLEKDPEWRTNVKQALSGDRINNQGRVRSDNVAAREHEGLLFRSRPEVYLYIALKEAGAVFAPLSVVIGGSAMGQRPRRIEPDFIIYKEGIVTIAEVDGDSFHTETPVQAQQRLKFLLDEGPYLERIAASECDTKEKAREAVGRIMHGIEKRRRSK